MVISKRRIRFTLCSRWAFPYHQGGIPMHNYFLLELLKDGMDIALISSQNKQNDLYYSKKYNYKSNDFPYSENLSSNTISLPCGPHLSEEETEKIGKTQISIKKGI